MPEPIKGMQPSSSVLAKLPRIWRLTIIAAAVWVIGYTIPSFGIYRAAVTVEAPTPPSEGFDDWLARQTQQAKAAVAICVEQRRGLWDLPSDAMLIELEIQRRIAQMGETRELAQKAAEVTASAKEEKRKSDVTTRCEATVGWIDNTQYDKAYRERQAAIGELQHKAWERVETTLICLLGISAIPLVMGLVRRLYGWAMAGR